MCKFSFFLVVGSSAREFVGRGLVVKFTCLVEGRWRVTVVLFDVSEGRGKEDRLSLVGLVVNKKEKTFV